jgi:hypothetical protein
MLLGLTATTHLVPIFTSIASTVINELKIDVTRILLGDCHKDLHQALLVSI